MPSVERPTRRLFTVDEYYTMAEVGILRPDERVQLIEGDIFAMPPIGPEHADYVDNVAELFGDRVRHLARVRVQNPVQLADRGAPQPDVVLVRRPDDGTRSYRSRLPGSDDILLVVEIADTSLRFDLGEKATSYARNGVPELWVIDIAGDRVVVHREPSEHGYARVQSFTRGETIVALAFPDEAFRVDDILG